jgi:hypothetical protein
MCSLMVEKTDALLDKGDAELLGCLEDSLVVLGTGWSSDVLHTATAGSENVVDEWELFG